MQRTIPRSDVELLAHMCEGYLIDAFFLPLIPPSFFNQTVRENTFILAAPATGLVGMVVAIPLSSLKHFKHIEGSRTDYSIQRCQPAEAQLETVLNPLTDNSRQTLEFLW